MTTFTALGYPGEITTRLTKDGTLERAFRVLVGRELFEYCDTIPESEMQTAIGRLGELRLRAVVRRIEREMKRRGVKVKRVE